MTYYDTGSAPEVSGRILRSRLNQALSSPRHSAASNRQSSYTCAGSTNESASTTTPQKAIRWRTVSYTQESKALLKPKPRKVVELRESGKTFREIGEVLGIARGHASSLYVNARKQMQAYRGSLDGLSQRARNRLSSEGLETREQVLAALNEGALNPDHIGYYGRKTHAEVCRWAGVDPIEYRRTLAARRACHISAMIREYYRKQVDQ